MTVDRAIANEIGRVQRQLEHYRQFLDLDPDSLSAVKQEISGWSIASHLDHTLKVARAIATCIADANERPGPGMSWLGRVVLLTGYIPRGRAKSPAAVSGQPSSKEELEAALSDVAGQLEQLSSGLAAVGSLRVVPHPRFGILTAKQGLRFVVVHTAHHLKIVREILAVHRRQ